MSFSFFSVIFFDVIKNAMINQGSNKKNCLILSVMTESGSISVAAQKPLQISCCNFVSTSSGDAVDDSKGCCAEYSPAFFQNLGQTSVPRTTSAQASMQLTSHASAKAWHGSQYISLIHYLFHEKRVFCVNIIGGYPNTHSCALFLFLQNMAR